MTPHLGAGLVAAVLVTAAVSAAACARGQHSRTAGATAGSWHTLAGEPRDAAAADSLIAGLLVEHRLQALSAAVVMESAAPHRPLPGPGLPSRQARRTVS